MTLHEADRRCITILLPPGMNLGCGGIGLLVRYALRRRGAAPWGGIIAERFGDPRRGPTLLLARPSRPVEVTVPEYALAFIHNYFMD